MSRYWNRLDDYHPCTSPEARSATGSGAPEPVNQSVDS
jgi:hypothetical protein